MLKSVQQGAATSVYLAVCVSAGEGGYFSDSNRASPMALAQDLGVAERLWTLSESMVGL